MINENHLTEAGMKATMEAQRKFKPFPWSDIGTLGPFQPVPKPARMKYNGTVGMLLVSRLRNVIEAMRHNGYDIDIWIGRGFFEKPYVITASKQDMDIFWRNMEP